MSNKSNLDNKKIALRIGIFDILRMSNIPERCHRMKRYAEYEDSVTEWLGRIPAHWELKRPIMRQSFLNLERKQLLLQQRSEVVP